jgi:hypothetical protein
VKLTPWRRRRTAPPLPGEHDASASAAVEHDASRPARGEPVASDVGRYPAAEVLSDASRPTSRDTTAADASRCTGANRYGTRCRLDAAPGTDRCVFHPHPKEQPE